jgi:hypothetical protein
MNDVRPQLEMHEQILNKYKKMLFDNNDEQKHAQTKSVNYNRAQSFDTSYMESNLNVDVISSNLYRKTWKLMLTSLIIIEICPR